MSDTKSPDPGITRKGVWVRFSFYLVLAGLNTLIPALVDLDSERMATMLWPQWSAFWLTPLAAMVLAGRLFLDQSLSRLNGNGYKDSASVPAKDEPRVTAVPKPTAPIGAVSTPTPNE